MSREFTLGQILNITTGLMLTGWDDIYSILNYMTGTSLYTHELPAAARQATSLLLETFPQLSTIVVPTQEYINKNWGTYEADPIALKNNIDKWIEDQEKLVGFHSAEVPTLTQYNNTDPINSLLAMMLSQ